MALFLPPDHTEVTLRWSLSGDPEVMTTSIAYQWNDDLDALDTADMLDSEIVAWMGQWGGGYLFLGSHRRTNIGGVIFEDESVEATPSGVPATQVLPQNCSLLVRKRTGQAGRANRGRLYFPPGRLADVDITDTGMLDPSAVATIQTEVNDIFTIIEPSFVNWKVLHTETAPGVGPAPTTITSFQVDGRIATQRRRLR